jgi:hypothetical protein
MQMAFVDHFKRRWIQLRFDRVNYFDFKPHYFTLNLFYPATNGLLSPALVHKESCDMKKNDPFGFDMSVSSAKKKNPRGRRGMSGASETSQRVCEHDKCQEHAKFRAPKSPDTMDDYFWFCQEHVREYNLKWNFFDGTSEAELMAQQAKDRVWERPTKPFKKSEEEIAWARLGVDDPHQVLGGNATQNPGRNPNAGNTRRLPPTERRAVEVLEAKDTMSKPQIRKQYKALIKVLHPDMNGGDRSQEEQLAEVVWAWEQIKSSKHFREKD